MKVRDKVVVVTGGASGIGRALCLRFAREGARTVVVADLDESGARDVVREIGDVGTALHVDVSREEEVASLVDRTEARWGPIDLFCSNAGIFTPGGLETPDVDWDRMWSVNVLAHVYAARHLVPRMIERGGGYLLTTASAAGLLSQIGSVTYAVTKHAAVALAEWIAITHGADGIKVSVLCPQAVRTPMLTSEDGSVASVDGVLEPEEVADAVIDALDEERLLVLPHGQVSEYVRRKAEDPDRWIAGMQRLQSRFGAGE
ncbi:MAG: SDR family oxidoreductase [Longimicrobiales bacterium]|nr:SDR family oxidoreductase [Longimicrobiales bacterium]